jgi:hypothetical protein
VKQIRKRITYANVMSSIAVFFVLGGATAFAAQKIGSNEIKGNAITTGKIKKEAVTATKLKKSSVITAKIANGAVTTEKIANDAVTGEKVKESTLGEVPKATTATTATTATNLEAPEAFHTVGAAGQPPFENGFVNFGGGFETAGFYRDRQCVIHLKGVITGSSNVAFTLPTGFRPAESTFSSIPATGETGNLEVRTNGTVEVSSPTAGAKNFGLSGQTFRVAGC